MAADTGKQNNLALHLDKIAYISGGVLVLVILLLPVVMTRDLKDLQASVKGLQDSVETRIRNQVIPEQPVPDLEADIQKQWQVAPSAPQSIDGWTTEPRPAVVQLIKGDPLKAPEHEPGKIVKVSCERDASKRQPYLKVTAEGGKIERCKLLKAIIRRPEAGGTARDLATLSRSPLVHNDYDVSPGKGYSYTLVTEVGPDGGRGSGQLQPDMVRKESEPLATPPVPFDYAVNIVIAIPFDPAANTPAKLNAEMTFWDYGSGKVAKASKPNWAEGDTFGPKVGDQDRYKIVFIGENTVTVQDRAVATLRQEKLTAKENRRPVAPFPEVVAGAVLATSEGGETGAPKKASGSDDAKATPKKATTKADDEPPPKKPAPKKDAGKDKKKDAKDKKKRPGLK